MTGPRHPEAFLPSDGPGLSQPSRERPPPDEKHCVCLRPSPKPANTGTTVGREKQTDPQEHANPEPVRKHDVPCNY